MGKKCSRIFFIDPNESKSDIIIIITVCVPAAPALENAIVQTSENCQRQ